MEMGIMHSGKRFEEGLWFYLFMFKLRSHTVFPCPLSNRTHFQLITYIKYAVLVLPHFSLTSTKNKINIKIK